jgi:hypothetical protein
LITECLIFWIKWELLWRKLKSKHFYDKLREKFSHIWKKELKETYMMIRLLYKKNRTEEENQFIKEQLWDLAKMWIWVTWWIAPWWMIIYAICYKLGLDLRPSAMKELDEN